MNAVWGSKLSYIIVTFVKSSRKMEQVVSQMDNIQSIEVMFEQKRYRTASDGKGTALGTANARAGGRGRREVGVSGHGEICPWGKGIYSIN